MILISSLQMKNIIVENLYEFQKIGSKNFTEFRQTQNYLKFLLTPLKRQISNSIISKIVSFNFRLRVREPEIFETLITSSK